MKQRDDGPLTDAKINKLEQFLLIAEIVKHAGESRNSVRETIESFNGAHHGGIGARQPAR